MIVISLKYYLNQIIYLVTYKLMNAITKTITKNILPIILCVFCVFSIPNSLALENYGGETI